MQNPARPRKVNAFLKQTILSVAISAAGTFSTQAAEEAADPGDYDALPAGTNLAILYGQYGSADKFRANGDLTPGDAGLDTKIVLARLVHYMDIGGYIVDPQIILPFGQVELKEPLDTIAASSESGIGDPTLGATVWLLNNPEQREYLGLSAFASVPIGDYEADKGPINIGENRWKGIFQLGYVRSLSDNVILDLIAEYSVFEDNDDFLGFRLQQDATQSGQAHLRYILSPGTHLGLSYYHDFGGETNVGGLDQDDELDNNRWLATFATFVAPTLQLQIQGGQDINSENGFEEDARVNLRILKVF